MSECNHITLVKQVGPLDGGPAKSTRYRCTECGAFVVTAPYSVQVTIGPPEEIAREEVFEKWWLDGDWEAPNEITLARGAFMAGWDARGERK